MQTGSGDAREQAQNRLRLNKYTLPLVWDVEPADRLPTPTEEITMARRTEENDDTCTAIEETPWEHESVDNLVEYLGDCGRTQYTSDELQAVASHLRIRYQIVKHDLDSFGLTLALLWYGWGLVFRVRPWRNRHLDRLFARLGWTDKGADDAR